jgi:hypothetical protein
LLVFYSPHSNPLQQERGKYSVPLFEKEGLGEILLDKSLSIPLFQRRR